ncbi:hypothetical protein [Hominibacterium faecale]|uniref:hypothetical protein n=1 Tax=Hominibacterium faecale TaxID=2839743 RepID=UPI0022B2AC06|nr:hypothetical protein [Hominibacterium faecale]
MKKTISVILVLTLVLGMSSILTGCGSSLNREVSIQGMTLKVPSEWAETSQDGNDEEKGIIYYEEKKDEQDEDETVNRIIIKYQNLKKAPYKAAAEAIEAEHKNIESNHGTIFWSIDNENSKTIDGAQITAYEYSFLKEINGIRQKYEGQIIYAYSVDTCYEIAVYGDGVSTDKIMGTLAF